MCCLVGYIKTLLFKTMPPAPLVPTNTFRAINYYTQKKTTINVIKLCINASYHKSHIYLTYQTGVLLLQSVAGPSLIKKYKSFHFHITIRIYSLIFQFAKGYIVVSFFKIVANYLSLFFITTTIE